MLGLKILIITTLSILIKKCIGMNSIVLKNVNISWIYNEEETHFHVLTTLADGINTENAWLGIGLNEYAQMGGTSVVLCRTSVQNGSVETWHNNGFAPRLVSSADPQLGLTGAKVSSDGGVLMCMYTRKNMVSNDQYYNVDNSSLPYLIVAYGEGDIAFHGKNVGATEETISLSGNLKPTKPTQNIILAFLKQIFDTIIQYILTFFGF